MQKFENIFWCSKYHLGVSHDQKLYIWRIKNENVQKKCLAPSAPKSRLEVCKICIFGGSKMPILGVKNAKICNFVCLFPNAPKSHLGVSHNEHLQNLHIWEGQKCPFWRSKIQNFATFFFHFKCHPKSFGGLL